MSKPTRRDFLRHTGVVMAGAAALPVAGGVVAGAAGANERIVIGVIGPGGMGSGLLKSFAAMKDVRISHVCDPDEGRMGSAARSVQQAAGNSPAAVKDLRRVLDDKDVDAVVIATPDHWHAPATILACEAGKHVYVEKPCSHNIREGRLMVEAARRSGRVVQTGTQSRSADYIMRAMELLKEGAIGEILVAKAWNSQLRSNIGKSQPEEPPAGFDYDLWVGPAPMVPFRANCHHSRWRWWRNFGCGDMGNDGVHDIDIARWGLGVEEHPSRISAMGGKYFFDDDQEFPDTQHICFEYETGGKRKQLIYEQRIWSPYVQEGHENGNAFYGTKGMLILGKHGGWQLFGERNQPRERSGGGLKDAPHHRNFLECIRDGNRPNADVEIGHLSATLCHLGNIATQLGRVLHFDAKTERITNDTEANAMVRRQYRERHWAVPKAL